MKNYKTMIAPIVSIICLGIATFTGHEITSDLQDQIITGVASLVAAGLGIYGVFKNHDKDGAK